MKYTEEQQRIIESTGDIVINAVAGSGKTTTLIEYARSRPDRCKILYLAFNSSVQKEATKKFESNGIKNVEVFTAHGLAMKHAFANKGFSLKKGNYKPYEISELLGITPDPKNHTELILAKHILRFAAYYCNSNADKPGDLNYIETLSDKQAIQFASNFYDVLQEKTSFFLKQMNSKKLEVTHDFYLKKFQLSSPKLPYDYILFDEGQDASMAMLDVFLKQKATKIIVGDTHQQIYGWRFAINSLQKVDYPNYSLSQSFRFDDQIAFLANNILSWKRKYFKQAPITIKGCSVQKEFFSTATIARTNVALLDAAIKYIQNHPLDRIYFEGNIKSYTYAEESGTSVYDVLNLANGKHDLIKDSLVRRMADIDELIQYVEKTEDSAIGMILQMVTKYGNELPGLIDELKRKHVLDTHKIEADMIFSTLHRCKGMEYDRVVLCDDFMTEQTISEALKNDDITETKKNQLSEEINALYVACTRAKSKLCLPTSINPFDTIQWEYPGDKLDKRELTARLRNLNTMEELKRMMTELGLVDNRPANHGKKWERHELDLLIKLFDSGITKEEIACQIQRSSVAVEMKLQSLGKSFF